MRPAAQAPHPPFGLNGSRLLYGLAQAARVLLLIGVLHLQLGSSCSGAASQEGDWAARSSSQDSFGTVEVWIDSGPTPLAAYQVKVIAKPGSIKLLGVEGGTPAAFRNPPRFDPKALRRDRIVLGAFTLEGAAQLPTGSYRVARLHVQLQAHTDPQFEIIIMAAADSEGRPVPIKASLKRPPAP